MTQNNSAKKKEEGGVFNALVFGAILAAGGFAGARVATHMIPDSSVAAICGAVMLPLGVILGLSFALKAMPTIALLNLLSVLDGRHTVEHMFAETGGQSGGLLQLQIGVLAMPVIFNLAIAAVLDMFVKPAAAFADLAIWFGGSGLVFGLVVAVLLMLLTE